MLGYKHGEAAAFDLLYARHKGGLYRYLLRHLHGQPELVNELFQDVWMKVINSRQRYQPLAQFNTYLYHIAHNRLVDHWRSLNMYNIDIDSDNMTDESAVLPEQKIFEDQLKRQFEQHIAALPHEQRNTFLLKQEGALSLEEIAYVTGVNRETVKSRLRYAINKLRQGLAF